MRCGRKNGSGRRGFTLVEMLVVVIIVSIMSVAIIAEMHGTFEDAILRSTSRELADAFKAASSRAISANWPHRITIDRFSHRYFLERSTRGGTEFYPVRGVPGGSGKLDPRIRIDILRPGVNAPDDAGEEQPGGAEAGNGNAVPAVMPEAAVTFYADGTADARQIELVDRDGFRMVLRVDPVTSRVQIKAMQRP
jgi:prepilin-type N-terminal cleavage/methylation domain-containing protein